MIEMADPSIESAMPLRRRLGLPLLVLYGTNITIGAGIYVLIGQVAGHAGAYAPWSFVLAATVMALTVASYAELSTRFPVSAGEAAYVMAAFRSRRFATTIGLMTVAIGVISSATVTLGSAGYIQQFINLPPYLIAVAVVLFLGGVAAWGILESVLLASVFTRDRNRRIAGYHHRGDPRRPAFRSGDCTDAAAGRDGVVRHRLRQSACLFCLHRV